MNTYSRLNSANNAKSGSLAKLSSGLRINKAGDDAGGLAISEKMRGQIGGLKQATRNAQDGISLVQTADANVIENKGNLGAGMADATTLDSLTDKDGNNLVIAIGDTITAPWSVNGTQKEVTLTAGNIDTLLAMSDSNAAIAGDDTVAIAATATGVTTITAANPGKSGWNSKSIRNSYQSN